jgi:SpoVK/Ycf46/Vps4 family AAA+-type ATPase
VAIFEDLDVFGADVALKSSFLNMVDGLNTCEGVLTIATTNSPDSLDSSFTGRPSRFDSFYVLGCPGADERERMLRARLGRKGKLLAPEDVGHVVRDTDGLSMACVQEVAACSLLTAMKEGKPLSARHLRDSVRKVRKHMKASKDGAERWAKGTIGFSGRQTT